MGEGTLAVGARPTADGGADGGRARGRAQILAHRFLSPDAPAPVALPMCYHAFLSHAQADASGTVAHVFHCYAALGLHTWLDMRQKKLTLAGMREGVLASDVFLLVLSKSVLRSWFCKCAPRAARQTPPAKRRLPAPCFGRTRRRPLGAA